MESFGRSSWFINDAERYWKVSLFAVALNASLVVLDVKCLLKFLCHDLASFSNSGTQTFHSPLQGSVSNQGTHRNECKL